MRVALRSTTTWLFVLAAMLLVGTAAVAMTGSYAGAGVAIEPLDQDVAWTTVLDAAEYAASHVRYEATMQVVQIDVDGPYVTEITLVSDGGMIQIGEPERWLVGRDDVAGYFVDGTDGTALRTVSTEQSVMDHDLLDEHYLVEVVGRATLETGPAVAVSFTRRRAMAPSERLFIDDATSLVVRRETYDEAGEPVRVVALRDLRTESALLDGPALDDAVPAQPQLALSDDAIRLLDDAGWFAPRMLRDGAALVSATAMDEDAGAVQLVYSDGLYRISVYQQAGTLAADELVGAITVEHEGRQYHRWPGSEPERLVWSGAGHTFTAISDAPVGALLASLDVLPADSPTGFGQRMRRGLARVGSWMWPF